MTRNPPHTRRSKASRQATQREAKKSDTYMLGFVARYVSEINSFEGKGFLTEVIYYPHHTDMRVIRRSGKSQIDAFVKCIKGAMAVTDKRWKNDGGDREIWRYLSARVASTNGVRVSKPLKVSTRANKRKKK